jgi:hypothetical protein
MPLLDFNGVFIIVFGTEKGIPATACILATMAISTAVRGANVWGSKQSGW